MMFINTLRHIVFELIYLFVLAILFVVFLHLFVNFFIYAAI